MSTSRIRLPDDWRRFDTTGSIGALLFPLALALLWLTGFGPTAYRTCERVAAEIQMKSERGKVTLAGRVANNVDKTALIDAARANYGADNVVDNLKVDDAVVPLAWNRNAPSLLKRLKALGSTATLRVKGDEAGVEGEVADGAIRDSALRELAGLIGKQTKLTDGLAIKAPPPPPVPQPAARPAEPVIAAGTLGNYRLPDGTDISIAGQGLESRLLAFLNDPSRQVDRGLWFDFDRLQFNTGSTSLTPASKAQIDNVVAILKAYPSVAVKIGGYTDNVGDPDANLKLSASRAARVAEELTGLGIAAERLEADGYGEQHPIADNATAEGRALNRRTALSVRRK